MKNLNFQHLEYFWTVVRQGSVTAAAAELHLAPSTVSAQVSRLEEAVGAELLRRSGRRLVLTDLGQLVYDYAEQIFALGRELQESVASREARAGHLRVGVAGVIHKFVLAKLLRPAVSLSPDTHLVCELGSPDRLLATLGTHGLDLVLTDAPAPHGRSLRVESHLLGECGVGLFGSPELVAQHAGEFPQNLNGAPLLLPPWRSWLRQAVESYLDRVDVHPRVAGELNDSALAKVLGREGFGFFLAPLVIRDEIARHYEVELLGELEGVTERFYAITAERKTTHSLVTAVIESARAQVFEKP